MSKKIFEVWFDFYDGTQANLGGYQERVKTFMSEEKAVAEKDRLNAECEYENPYYIKEVELDE